MNAPQILHKSESEAMAAAPIQFFDLKSQQARIRAKVEARFSKILDHGAYINGPEVAEMEDLLKSFVGANDCVAVGSGTQAIIMPLLAWGLGHGDAVFIPAFTYNATANSVLVSGATPVFVDIDPKTFNMCPDDLSRRIEEVKRRRTLRPRAVIAVDLYGLPADYARLKAVCDAHGLKLMADAAQSFGGRLDNQWVGAIADVTATSFYPSKALGCYGDGGAIFCQDPAFAEEMRSIRWHGTGADRKESVRVGINGRLDSIQCAIVTEKMGLFEDELEARARTAARYDARIRPHCDPYQPQSGAQSGYGLYTVAVEDRGRVAAHMKEKGVPTAIYYLQALHEMAAFRPWAPEGGLPHSERAARRVLSLPMHGYVSEAQAERVCEAFEAAMAAQ